MARWIRVTDEIHDYIADHLGPEPDVLQALRAETGKLRGAGMQISHEQARFMTVVIKSLQARNTLEIGVFTGYSALITALALPADGRVVACDVSDEWTRIGRPFWQQAGVDAKIDLRLAPAGETLAALIEAGGSGRYDFAFIDADKTGYDDYYEKCLVLLRRGGLIMLDNMLWSGAVVNAEADDADTVAIRSLNDKISDDPRVDSYLVPIGDGIHLAYKR